MWDLGSTRQRGSYSGPYCTDGLSNLRGSPELYPLWWPTACETVQGAKSSGGRTAFFKDRQPSHPESHIKKMERSKHRRVSVSSSRLSEKAANPLVPLYGRPRKEPMRFSGSMRSQKILKVAKMGTASNVPGTPQR